MIFDTKSYIGKKLDHTPLIETPSKIKSETL